eukprot:scaffold86535_cov18-Tisochrysis_lutea.AAC.1
MGWGCFKFSLPPEFLEALQQDFVRKNGFQGLRTVLWHLFGANTILAWVKAEGDVETRGRGRGLGGVGGRSGGPRPNVRVPSIKISSSPGLCKVFRRAAVQ